MFDDLLEIRTGGPELDMGSGPSHMARIRTLEEWETKAAALREIYETVLGEGPQAGGELDVVLLEEVDCGSYVRRTLEYAADFEERIKAYLLLPKGLKGKRPAVVCVHPTTPMGKEQAAGGDQSEAGRNLAYGLHLVQRGYITLAYDLMAAGDRCYPGLKHFDTAPFYLKYPAWSARGKDLADFGRAVDLLETIDEVDAHRIGCIGHSQGGGIAIQATAVESRIRAGVSSCGWWPQRLAKNPYNVARTGWWVGLPRLRPYCLSGKPFPIDLHEYLALCAPRAIMHIVALNDFMYSPQEESITRTALENLGSNVKKIYELYGAQDRFVNLLHMNGHGFDPRQREAAYCFLDRQLDHAPVDT